MPDLQFLDVQTVDGVTTVTINKPPLNLFDFALLQELTIVGERCASDPKTRAVIMQSATPGFFIAHFDVSLILTFPTDRVHGHEAGAFTRVCELYRTMPKLTIAVIEGRVGGGGSELAMSFDVRYAARETAIFNQPEVALGIIPGGGGTQRLPRLIGRSRAMEVILGCDDIDATTAEAWGWVNRAFPASEVRAAAQRLAQRTAGFPPHAVAEAKASILRADAAITESLIEESRAFMRTLELGRPAMEHFMERGGQTVAGESRLGELATELG
jgi:enoyl-CoA hydratase/carnithine racemase